MHGPTVRTRVHRCTCLCFFYFLRLKYRTLKWCNGVAGRDCHGASVIRVPPIAIPPSTINTEWSDKKRIRNGNISGKNYCFAYVLDDGKNQSRSYHNGNASHHTPADHWVERLNAREVERRFSIIFNDSKSPRERAISPSHKSWCPSMVDFLINYRPNILDVTSRYHTAVLNRVQYVIKHKQVTLWRGEFACTEIYRCKLHTLLKKEKSSWPTRDYTDLI